MSTPSRRRSCPRGSTRPSARSAVRDLLTFLLTPPPPADPRITPRDDRPRARTGRRSTRLAGGVPAARSRGLRSSWSPGRRTTGRASTTIRLAAALVELLGAADRRRRRDGRRAGRRRRSSQKADVIVFYPARRLGRPSGRGHRRLPRPRRRAGRTSTTRSTASKDAPALPGGSAWRGGRRGRSSATARSTWISPGRRSTRSPNFRRLPGSSTRATGTSSATRPRSRCLRRRRGRQAATAVLDAESGKGRVFVASPATTVDVRRPAVPPVLAPGWPGWPESRSTASTPRPRPAWNSVRIAEV